MRVDSSRQREENDKITRIDIATQLVFPLARALAPVTRWTSSYIFCVFLGLLLLLSAVLLSMRWMPIQAGTGQRLRTDPDRHSARSAFHAGPVGERPPALATDSATRLAAVSATPSADDNHSREVPKRSELGAPVGELLVLEADGPMSAAPERLVAGCGDAARTSAHSLGEEGCDEF